MHRGFRILILFAIAPLILSFAGCEKKTGVAIVLEKEHIAAKKTGGGEFRLRRPPQKMNAASANEITVDQYIMDAAVRGTDRDPRATDHEQWIVKVRMMNGRQFNVQADQSRWKKLERRRARLCHLPAGKIHRHGLGLQDSLGSLPAAIVIR